MKGKQKVYSSSGDYFSTFDKTGRKKTLQPSLYRCKIYSSQLKV